jgi:uncharacterized membrane protein YkoI
MNRTGCAVLAAMMLGAPAIGLGEPAARDDRFAACLAAVAATRAGRVIKVEFKEERGAQVYEFNVRSPDGTDWDVECAAESAAIVETEQEVTGVRHPAFAAYARIDEAAARARVLELYPGEIIEVEYEIEPGGRAVYELDVKTRAGPEIKNEVDAATGGIIEADAELWQVGYE